MGGDTQERSWAVLKPGGILISTIQPPSEETTAAHGVRQQFISTSPPIGKVLSEVAAMVDAGQIKPEVSKTLALQEIRTPHALIEGRHTRGKIVVQVAQ